jgi:hypothetical protein
MRMSGLNPVLWQYSPAVAMDRLMLHHRACMRLLKLWCWSCVAFLAEVAKILAFGRHTWEWAAVVLLGALCLLLTVPAPFGLVWLREIDRALQQRGVYLSSSKDIEWRISTTACKMMLWFVIIVLAATVLSWLK